MRHTKTDIELLDDYWAAYAQFGPFDIGPGEYLRLCHEAQVAENRPLATKWLTLIVENI